MYVRKQNGVQVLRYEKPERNGDGMECIDLKHTDTINTCVLFPAQLMGGGETLWFFIKGVNTSQREKIYHWKAKEKSSGNTHGMKPVKWKECSFCCGVLRRMHELKVK